jgi:hypothetical protein
MIFSFYFFPIDNIVLIISITFEKDLVKYCVNVKNRRLTQAAVLISSFLDIESQTLWHTAIPSDVFHLMVPQIK